MKRQSGPRLNKSKNVDLTGQGDTTNLQSSIFNCQFGSGSFSKNLIIPEAVMFSKG
jgi:acyl-CoA hydrolase